MNTLTIESVRRELEDGRSKPSSIINRCLEAISRLNKVYSVFISVFTEEAKRASEELDLLAREGERVPPLFSAPLAIKDNIWVRGHPTTAAVKLFQNFTPQSDAQAVKWLRRHNTIIVGKNNMHALALGATSTSSLFGPVRNPYDQSRIAGGSSGGTAAAIALSMAAAGIGTDTGGSVRIPAAFCGLVGYKPTWGTISLRGVIPLSPTLDHVGILTRNVSDAQILFEALTQGRVGTLRSPAAHRRAPCIGVAENYCRELEARVERDFHRAVDRLEGLDYRIEWVRLPSPGLVHRARSTIMLREAATIYGEALERSPEDFPPDVRALLQRGAKIDESSYIDALSFRSEVAARLAHLLRKVDFIAMPTVWVVAPKLEDVVGREHGVIRRALLTNTGLFNLTGMPALTLPMASRHGLFTGLQVAAGPGADLRLLAFARRLERALWGPG